MIIETERLILSPLKLTDAAFIVELLNDPDWIRFIGDRGVTNGQKAKDYLTRGPIKMMQQKGVSIMAVRVKDTAYPIGVCGLIKRDSMIDYDLGYGFLPGARGNGYAREAAAASIKYGFEKLKLQQIAAITSQDNAASIRLLTDFGFQFEKEFQMENDTETLNYYVLKNPIFPKDR